MPCEFSTSPANPLRVSCVLLRSRCGAMRSLNVAPRGASSKFCSQSLTLSWFWAGGGAGVRSVLRILLVIDDPLVVFGWRRCFFSAGGRSRCFRRAAALARGASCELIDDPLVVFGGGSAGAWSVLRILFVVDDRGFGRPAAPQHQPRAHALQQLHRASAPRRIHHPHTPHHLHPAHTPQQLQRATTAAPRTRPDTRPVLTWN